MRKNTTEIHKNQYGFTLLELLVALFLTMILIVSVQRYLASLVVDHQGMSEQQDKSTQVRIALSNIKRDVAQAGYFPYATQLNDHDLLGAFVNNNELTVRSFQPKKDAYDCNGAAKQFSSDEWVYVVNTYAVIKDSLTCNGNGGNNGRVVILDDVFEMMINPININQHNNLNAVSMINVCLIFSASSISIGDVPTTKKCDNTTPISQASNNKYYKVIIDMPIMSTPFNTEN